jgi:hypothetical protein
MYWKLTEEGVAVGYPRAITTMWPGLPSNIDAAFTYNKNGKTYFFKVKKRNFKCIHQKYNAPLYRVHSIGVILEPRRTLVTLKRLATVSREFQATLMQHLCGAGTAKSTFSKVLDHVNHDNMKYYNKRSVFWRCRYPVLQI